MMPGTWKRHALRLFSEGREEQLEAHRAELARVTRAERRWFVAMVVGGALVVVLLINACAPRVRPIEPPDDGRHHGLVIVGPPGGGG